MHRRQFVVQASLFSAAGLLARSIVLGQSPKSAPPATPDFKPLRGNVGFFTARGGTIGWLVNKEAIAAVDTQFPDTAKLFLDGLPGRRGRQLDVLVDSHHHGDHTGGNGVFKPATKTIVAHANVPGLQRARAEKDNTLDRQTYADTTFPTTWRKDVGGEAIALKYHGAAHTGGDIITLFEQANVVHMGDLMFHRMYPVIDRPGGGTIKGWVNVLEAAAKAYPADAVYIFGHGNPKFGVTGQRGDLLSFRDYLSALLDYTQQRIKAGDPKEKIVTLENLPGFPDYHVPRGPANRLPSNLSAAYDELTASKG